MIHRDFIVMTFDVISERKEANDEDLFLEINDSYDFKQIYFHILSNMNNINRISFFNRRNVETMQFIRHVLFLLREME